MDNEKLRNYAWGKGVKLWQIAEKFGITDASLSRKMRKELNKEDAGKFKEYVDQIVLERSET